MAAPKKFPFKVGDKVCLSTWKENAYAQITFMGEQKFMFSDNEGQENSGAYSLAWKGWTKPKPKK